MPRPTIYIKLKCKKCGKTFKRIKWQHAQHIKRKMKNSYCSNRCKNSRSMESHPNWKGGKHHYATGYIVINLGNGKRIFEHRLIMERKIGRKLKKGEVIHHINGNPSDNRIKNLILCKTHGCHTEKYHPQNRIKGKFNGIQKSNR